MKYRLLRDDDRSVVTMSEDLDGELAATTWARAWLDEVGPGFLDSLAAKLS